MLIFIVAYIKDTGDMLTELTGIEWSFEVRRDHFWSFVRFPICGSGWICEVQGIYLTTHIGFCRNACISPKARILVYRILTHN